MTGNSPGSFGIAVRICALAGALMLLTGCGFKLAGPAETVSVATLASEDLSGPCKFDLNMPDQALTALGEAPTASTPAPKEVAALVIYERGNSADLFNDNQVQNMAAALHMVTVFAHQCNSKSHGDIQADATKGQGRTLFQALQQYSVDSKHPEIAGLKVVVSGFSAAGVLSTTLVNAYPDRVLGFLPYASGSIWVDLETIPVTAAAAKVPALVLANAYDPNSGVMRSLRYFQRGWSQGAPWGFGVQNHTGHCCVNSIRDVMIPWVTALVEPLETGAVLTSADAAATAATTAAKPRSAGVVLPTVRFTCYTDGFYDSYGESNCWIPSASILPSTDGGSEAGWLPNTTAADAWLKWVQSADTN